MLDDILMIYPHTDTLDGLNEVSWDVIMNSITTDIIAYSLQLDGWVVE